MELAEPLVETIKAFAASGEAALGPGLRERGARCPRATSWRASGASSRRRCGRRWRWTAATWCSRATATESWRSTSRAPARAARAPRRRFASGSSSASGRRSRRWRRWCPSRVGSEGSGTSALGHPPARADEEAWPARGAPGGERSWMLGGRRSCDGAFGEVDDGAQRSRRRRRRMTRRGRLTLAAAGAVRGGGCVWCRRAGPDRPRGRRALARAARGAAARARRGAAAGAALGAGRRCSGACPASREAFRRGARQRRLAAAARRPGHAALGVAARARRPPRPRDTTACRVHLRRRAHRARLRACSPRATSTSATCS